MDLNAPISQNERQTFNSFGHSVWSWLSWWLLHYQPAGRVETQLMEQPAWPSWHRSWTSSQPVVEVNKPTRHMTRMVRAIMVCGQLDLLAISLNKSPNPWKIGTRVSSAHGKHALNNPNRHTDCLSQVWQWLRQWLRFVCDLSSVKRDWINTLWRQAGIVVCDIYKYISHVTIYIYITNDYSSLHWLCVFSISIYTNIIRMERSSILYVCVGFESATPILAHWPGERAVTMTWRSAILHHGKGFDMLHSNSFPLQ